MMIPNPIRSINTVKKMTAKRERVAVAVRGWPRASGPSRRRSRPSHGERDEPLAPEAPESGDAMHDPELEIALGEGPSERGQHDLRDGGFHRRERLELVPEGLWIVQAIQRHLTQRRVMLREHERVSPFLEGLLVAVENCPHRLLAIDSQVVIFARDQRAGG